MSQSYAFSIRNLARETILGYIFWMLFQALAPMIWFYPLNELDITGYEVFAFSLFTPVLYGVPIVRRLVCSRLGLSLLRLAAVASVASLQAPTTLSRLVILSAGCGCVMLVFTVKIFTGSSHERALSHCGLITGLLAFVASRVWYTSFVPAWWDNTSNNIVIALGVIATLDKIFTGETCDSLPTPDNRPPSWLCMGVGLGCLLYVTNAVFGEVSLITRWSVGPYPNTGPSPYPWGGLVLLAMWLGASGLLVYPGLLWYLCGTAGFLALYYLNTWLAYTGGVILAVFIMMCWLSLLDGIILCPPARTLSLALLIWLLNTFFSIWTVAYNFVPGGVYTREHTDWLVIFNILGLGLGVYSRNANVVAKEKLMPNRNVLLVISLITLVGLGGFVARYDKQQFNHEPKVLPDADFTAAIWTFHFGYDNKGWQSMERAADVMNATGADVITLLESDASKPYLGNNDLAMWMSERLSMYVDFGPSTRDHTWGNLLLSKYPIVKSKHHLMPSPHGELAPAITATINMTGLLVDFVVTHMGNDRDVLDRKLQAEFLSAELSAADNPVVFLGYVTSSPGSREYNKLLRSGNVKDIDSSDQERWCEYIMYRGLIRLGYARLSHGGLTDTELQMARFRFPQDPTNFRDHDRIVTSSKEVEKKTRFTSRFGGLGKGHNWKSNHRYHMNTPKYFLP